MAPFRYESGIDSRIAGSLADLMLRRGDIRAQQARESANANARATEIGGQAWAGAAQNIGQSVAAIPQQIEHAKVQQQQQETSAIALTQAKRSEAARNILAQTMQDVPKLSENGVSVWDVPTITRAMADRGFGPEAGAAAQHLDGINNAFRQARAAQVALVQKGAESVAAAGNDPVLAGHFLDQMEANQLMPAADLAKYREFLKADPTNTEKLTAYLMAPQKGVVVGEGGSLVNPVTNKATFTGKAKPKTETELALDAAGGDAAAAMKLLKPAPNRTSEQDDQRYRDIVAKKELKQPITAADAAWATGYEHQKTLGIDTSASAAATRQANAIAASTAQQARAQGFTEAQAGRAELTNKVEAPYRQAQQSAQELRDLVHAAQAGNKEAASLQSLQATMSVVRANGLNRLNQAEMKLPEGAGSTWDRIAGKIGKLTSGQPIDASLQQDLLELSDLIEKGAYNRYSTSHKDITTRYKLADEKPAEPPAGYYSTKAPDGKTYTFASQEKLDAFKSAARIK